MENIIFDTTYTTFDQMIIKVFYFLIISGFLIYIIYFTLSKVLFKKSSNRKEINLQLTFLWSLLEFFVAFNIYIFVLFYKNGIDSSRWTTLNFYFGIIAQIILYIGIIAYFFIKRNFLMRMINTKSIK